ncbi:MAG: hypothetical protein Q9223_004595 [Gallowayella weberi]
MATAGPELPPHLLAKRKRQVEEEAEQNFPQPRSRSVSPTSSNASNSKRRRTIGPAPPPAPLSERPSPTPQTQNPSQTNSDSDSDDFGPSLPPPNGHTAPDHTPSSHNPTTTSEPSPKPQAREEWMLVPPTSTDWSSRLDPTKLRNRKFNTGKSSKGPPSKPGATGIDTIWTETPEQKRQRLQDEMMGVKKPAQLIDGGEEEQSRGDREDEAEKREVERRIREFNERNRGSGSLYEEHKKGTKSEKEDDPSARAFDKEKDMGGGMKIGHAKRKEMVGKAAEFGSRFAGGKYL